MAARIPLVHVLVGRAQRRQWTAPFSSNPSVGFGKGELDPLSCCRNGRSACSLRPADGVTFQPANGHTRRNDKIVVVEPGSSGGAGQPGRRPPRRV